MTIIVFRLVSAEKCAMNELDMSTPAAKSAK
jgi:hypothetical protein